MATAPAPKDLAQALRELTSTYANGRKGSDESPFGHCEVVSLQDVFPGRAPPGVLQGYGIRFEDGTVYLVNVHLIPGSVPKAPEVHSKEGE